MDLQVEQWSKILSHPKNIKLYAPAVKFGEMSEFFGSE